MKIRKGDKFKCIKMIPVTTENGKYDTVIAGAEVTEVDGKKVFLKSMFGNIYQISMSDFINHNILKIAKGIVLIATLAVMTSCSVQNRVRYTYAKDVQLYNFTTYIIVDSLSKKHVYGHDADNYRIHKHNIKVGYMPEIGDTFRLENMYSPLGIEIMYDWENNKAKIIKCK